MYKKILVFISLVILNLSLWAMDLNQTITIINEAQEATAPLQEQFNTTLLEEDTSLISEQPIEMNGNQEIIEERVINVIEINENHEHNNSLIEIVHNEETNSTTTITQEPISLLNMVETNETKETHNEFETHQTEVLKSRNNLHEPVSPLNTISGYEEENITTETHETNSSTKVESESAHIEGDSKRGITIFKTRIKPFCEMTGKKFAKQYMQEDWDDIYHDKEFKSEVIKACPKLEKRYKDSWTPDLYQFALEYASDSDAIPEC